MYSNNKEFPFTATEMMIHSYVATTLLVSLIKCIQELLMVDGWTKAKQIFDYL